MLTYSYRLVAGPHALRPGERLVQLGLSPEHPYWAGLGALVPAERERFWAERSVPFRSRIAAR